MPLVPATRERGAFFVPTVLRCGRGVVSTPMRNALDHPSLGSGIPELFQEPVFSSSIPKGVEKYILRSIASIVPCSKIMRTSKGAFSISSKPVLGAAEEQSFFLRQ